MADKKSQQISTLGSRLTSLVSVALVLILLGLAVLMGIAGKSLTDDLRRNLGFVIKMERNCPLADIDALNEELQLMSAFSSLTYLSADDIMTEESKYLGEEIATLVDANPYSPEFDIKVKPEYSSPDSINSLVELLGKREGVNEIVTESAVIEGVDSSLRRMSAVLLCVAAVLLVVSITLINNTISLSIYSRRFVIHTMKLVGATAAFIRRPFLIAGAINGLFAGLAASAVIIGMRFYISSLDPMLGQALNWGAVTGVCVSVILLGIAICVVTAMFATNRYLMASYDDMFLK